MSLEDLPEKMYEQFAQLGQALSDPTRLRMLNRLCQTEHSVQQLADQLGHSAANASAHLKVLRRARLVEKRKEGRRVLYRIASRQALRLWLALRDTGLKELPEVREAMRRYADGDDVIPDLSGEKLLEQVKNGDIVLLDLRPTDEYESGHLPEARSIPHYEIEERIDELDADETIVAYCRGPWCVGAIKAVGKLRKQGLDARRLPGGVAEWKAEGRSVEFCAPREQRL